MDETRFDYQHEPDNDDGLPHVFYADDRYDYASGFKIIEAAVKEWLDEHFGDADLHDTVRYSHNGAYNSVWIRYDDDALAFRMRWC